MKKDGWKLVNEDGTEVNEGLVVTDFRGEKHILKGGTPPHKEGSTGRVYVQLLTSEDNPIMDMAYFPTVFNLKWIREV